MNVQLRKFHILPEGEETGGGLNEPLIMNKTLAGGAGKASAEEIAGIRAPKSEKINCIITGVSGIIARMTPNGERSFKLVDYITKEGVKARIPIGTNFLGGPNKTGANDLLIARDNAVELTIQYTVAGETQYLERREGHVNEGKIITHTSTNTGVSNVTSLSTREAEVIDSQFRATEKALMAKGQLEQVKVFGAELAKYENSPAMLDRMTQLFAAAIQAK